MQKKLPSRAVAGSTAYKMSQYPAITAQNNLKLSLKIQMRANTRTKHHNAHTSAISTPQPRDSKKNVDIALQMH